MGNQDGVFKQAFGQIQVVALPDEIVVDAADDLEHVLFAFAQVVVVDAVELGGELVALLFQCPFGVDFLFAQNVDGFAREGNVGQQHQVQGDERAQFGRGVFGNCAAQLFQFFARGLMALSKRATSASSLSGSMSYWGTSVMPRV